MVSTTGNKIRDTLLRDTLANFLRSQPRDALSRDVLATWLPSDFDLLQSEFDSFAPVEVPSTVSNDTVEGTMAATEQPDAVSTAAPIEGVEFHEVPPGIVNGAKPIGPTAPPLAPAAPIVAPTPNEIDAADALAVAAQDELARCRHMLIVASNADARDVLSRSITQFQSGMSRYLSGMDIFHDVATASLEERRKIASGELRPSQQPRPANSVIDQMNAPGNRGSVNQSFGRGYRRGAYGREMYGRKIVPSEG